MRIAIIGARGIGASGIGASGIGACCILADEQKREGP